MVASISNKERYNKERQEQAEQRKLFVLDIAEDLFLKQGLGKTTMNDIMKAANVSKATLYRYYENIDEIAFEIEYKMLLEIFPKDMENKHDFSSSNEYVFMYLSELIDNFHQHEQAHYYISMFDNLYAKSYPSERLSNDYKEFFLKMNRVSKEYIHEDMEDYTRILTSFNIVLSFLQRLATRGRQLEKYQGISVDKQLEELRKMMEREYVNE